MKKLVKMIMQAGLIACVWLSSAALGKAQAPPDRVFFQMALSPDGTTLAIVERSSVTETGEVRYPIDFWDANTGQVIGSIENMEFQVISMAWHPNSQQLVTGDTFGNVIVWDVATGDSTLVESGGAVTSYGLKVSPTGELITGITGASAYVWGISGGTPYVIGDSFLTDQAIFSRCYDVAWNSTGTQLAVGAQDSTNNEWVKIYDLTGTESTVQPMARFDTEAMAAPLDWSPDDRFLAVGTTHPGIGIMDAVTGQVLKLFLTDRGVIELAWSPNGQRLAAITPEAVLIWDVQSEQLIQTYPVEENPLELYTLDWHPDGERVFYIGGFTHTVYINDTVLGAPTASTHPD